MARVTIVQMVYNAMKYIPQSFDSMTNQTYKDIEVVAVINGNEDGGKEYIKQYYPQVTVIDPGENLKFVRGHNMIFEQFKDTEFFQLVNNDMWMEPTHVEEMLKAFEDPKVAAVTGKIYQYNFNTKEKTNIIDTTGIELYKTGRARSRGQNQIDSGQFDKELDVFGADGAGCMYRRSALEEVKYQRPDGTYEYFDLEFYMYWEDADLSWRFVNAGYACKFAPKAIAYHGRTAASSPGGYARLFSFIQHHKKIASWIKQSNYKNHIFLYIKNSPKFYWKFFAREFFMLGYMVVFEMSTLKVLPLFFKQLPLIWKKRKYIQARRKISIEDMEAIFAAHPTDLRK
jgi:GT2 family glycosyltransferase